MGLYYYFQTERRETDAAAERCGWVHVCVCVCKRKVSESVGEREEMLCTFVVKLIFCLLTSPVLQIYTAWGILHSHFHLKDSFTCNLDLECLHPVKLQMYSTSFKR